MTDPQDFIDPDEGRDTPSPFYAHAEPCESCGEPTYRGRVWNLEHQLWIAQDCACNTPSLPTCPLLIPLLERADSVREICRVIRQHRATCPQCGPIEIRQSVPRKAA